MSTTPAVRLVIPADATVNLNHSASATARIPVSDTGRLPLRVTASVGDYTRHAQQFPGASWVTSISPSALVIQPGQTGFLTLHITVPPGEQGAHYVNLIARAAPVAGHGPAALSIAVGGTVRLDRPGTAAAAPVHGLRPHFVPPVHVNGGPPWLLLGAVLAVAVLAVTGALLALRRRSGRRAEAALRAMYPRYEARQPARHRAR